MFNLPNLSGRVTLGRTVGYNLDARGGSATPQLGSSHLPRHRHGDETLSGTGTASSAGSHRHDIRIPGLWRRRRSRGIGRLLITLLLVEREILPSPLLYLSAYFEASREDYYAHLLTVTQEGAWERWLAYFLRGVQVQAEDAIDRMVEIDDLFEEWREALADVQSGRPEEVLRLFIGNPFWTAGGIAEELGVAYTTARRAIERTEAAGIVSQTGTSKRNRVYCAREMLEVLEAPQAAGRSRSGKNATSGEGA